MFTRRVGPHLAGARRRLWLRVMALSVLVLQMGCATIAPLGSGLGSDGYWRLSSSGADVGLVPVQAPGGARVLDGGALREEALRERVWQVERTRAAALVLAAQREAREPEAAREAEADRALARVVAWCSGVEEVGATLAFTFWVEGGALTPVGYQEERGGGRVGLPVDAEGLARVLRRVFTEYVGRRAGEVVLRLRREESRWAVDYDATRLSVRPAEARTLPVRTQGTPADTFLAFHETIGKWTSAVRVPTGGAARAELEVQLEDGRLTGGRLSEVRRTSEGTGGSPQPLAGEVTGHLVQALLPFTEGLGARTVHVVLRAEHRLGDARAWGRVASVWVERPAQPPGQSWYLSMHEATLLRWREGVVEGSAWLSQRSVEEMVLWVAAGIIARGAGFFATEGLEWVTRAQGREPEVVAGWLRTALKRLNVEERAAFERLWQKVALEGEQTLSRGERNALRGLFARLEQVIQQPLNAGLKDSLRQEARAYYAELHPQFARILDDLRAELPIHHRRPLQYAHLFPAENINAAENLAMLRRAIHEEINFLWGRFRKARPNPTSDEVRRVAEIIDGQFEPWYHRVDNPPGLSKTAAQARDTALSELRSRFPGLD